MKKRFAITAMAYSKRGRLLSIGKNNYLKTHPLQAHFAQKVNKPHCIYLHAEIDALLKAKEPVHELRIFRYNSFGIPVKAKPCVICNEAILHFGVQKVIHT